MQQEIRSRQSFITLEIPRENKFKSAIMKSFTKFKIVLGLILIAIPIIALIMWFIESYIASSLISENGGYINREITECWAVIHQDSYGKVQLLLGLCGVAGAILVSSSKIDNEK
ncbi:MAG: hypothetical protein Q8909_11315 [Bacteroidota bacterium]|nr:hypothetical protein [Bacteroidota bacterium]